MYSKRKIFFRADAGSTIGYGHFIRSLALADMLKDDFDCVFYTQSPTEYQRKEANPVCPLVELPADNTRFELFLNELTGNEIVVLDNYFYTTDYQRRIKEKGCKLVCIDDMHDKHYVADVVINHGCDNPSLFSIEPYTKLYLGLDYALLRRPFLEAKTITKREYGHVVVTFGGSDWNNLTTKYARILSQKPDISQITAIVGDTFQHTNELEIIPKVQILRNLSAQQMADLFCRVQYAALSASTTCIEALSCQCPVYAIWYVENQKEFYDYLIREDYVSSLTTINDEHIFLFDTEKIKLISYRFANIKNNIIKAFNYGK
jgi:UDP-2,4-diacetamido-2,4,6-trideoxy-beta-L-altropyranose hydrolase